MSGLTNPAVVSFDQFHVNAIDVVGYTNCVIYMFIACSRHGLAYCNKI